MHKILLIEDNIEISENIAEILELEGYDVFVANNGIDGIKLAIENNPQLILCDILMPGLNGYEVFGQLKENNITCRIPFIFLTANTERRQIQEAFEMGVEDYINKPFDPDELVLSIKKRLEK